MIDQLDHPLALALLQRLDAISAQLAALPAAIATAQHAGSSLTRADRDALEILLPGIAVAVGAEKFAVRELILEDAERDEALRIVLERAMGELDASAAKRLGRLFRRADGIVVEGLHLQSGIKARAGLLWRVIRL